MVTVVSQSVVRQLKKRLVIKSPRDNPRAGIVILNDIGQEPQFLLIKEKGGGKRWGFPKGGVEYRCQSCHQLVRRKDYQTKIKEVCPKSQLKEKHDLQTETVQECAERETIEETGWSLDNLDEVLATRRVGNCTYLIVKSLKQNIVKICPKELLDFRWITLSQIQTEVQKDPYIFNFGARNIVPSLVRLLC